jgi:hypothetical protein
MDEGSTKVSSVGLPADHLQALVDYYRNRASELEFEYLQYQLASKATIQKLYSQLQEYTQASPPADQDPTEQST